MKLILTKLLDQHLPFYAIKTLLAQKPGLLSIVIIMFMIIVQNQALEMNATPKTITISVKKVPLVFVRVRISLFLYFPKHFSSACKINNSGYWH